MIPTVHINGKTFHLDEQGRLSIMRYSDYYHETVDMDFDKDGAVALKNFLNNYLHQR